MKMNDIKNSRRFYIYEFYKVDDMEVFYVGKGTGSRVYDRIHRNPYFLNVINKYNCSSHKILDNLTNEEAMDLEIKQIAIRRAQGHAYCNISDGGEGFPSGLSNPSYHRDVSGDKNPFYGKHHTLEIKKKISENRKGKGGRCGKDNPMCGKGMKGTDNPMYGKTGFAHHNHKKVLITYVDDSTEYLTSKQSETKFGTAFCRVRHSGGLLHYSNKSKNSKYEGALITIIEPVTTIEK